MLAFQEEPETARIGFAPAPFVFINIASSSWWLLLLNFYILHKASSSNQDKDFWKPQSSPIELEVQVMEKKQW